MKTMSEDNKVQAAKNVYKTLCEMMDDNKLDYQRNDDELFVSLTMHGEDIPMRIGIDVDKDMQFVSMFSTIPLVVAKDKHLDVAIATSQINFRLGTGSFLFNFENNYITFRLSTCFMDCLISKTLLERMLGIVCFTVDEYNDKFLMLVKGGMSLKKFLEVINK